MVERPPRARTRTPPRRERQLRVLRWGLVPFWAKDPSIGSQMINARMETVHEKPAYRRAFATRRCLLPADGYYEWYPTEQARPRPASRSSSRSSSAPPTARCWRWPGCTRSGATRPGDDDDPQRFRWTCTVLTTDGRGRARPHPRPDAAAGRAGPVRRLARPGELATRTTCASLLVPAAPGRLEAYPVSTAVNNVRNNGPELLEPRCRRRTPSTRPDLLEPVADPARRRPAGHRPLPAPRRHAAARPRRRGRHRGARPGRPRPATCPAQGITVIRVEQPWRVAGKRIAPAPAILDECLVAVADRLRARTPLVLGGRSAGARVGCRTARRARRRRGARARRSRCTRPGAPSVAARRAARRAGARRSWSRASGTRSAARGVPGRPADLAVVPGADHGLKVPSAARSSQPTTPWAVDASRRCLEFVVRDVDRESSGAEGVVLRGRGTDRSVPGHSA